TDFQQKTPFVRRNADLGAECDALLGGVALARMDNLRAESLGAHRQIFDRLRLDINGIATGKAEAGRANWEMDTRARIAASRERSDTLLALQVYDYARYLLICSSRPGSMPANLQGLWNDLPSPPWN